MWLDVGSPIVGAQLYHTNMNLELCNDPPSKGPAYFYECRFYYMSNFSSFAVSYDGYHYPTSEHAYHASKFGPRTAQAKEIREATSAHEAMMIARKNKEFVLRDWDQIKRPVMKGICRAKMQQHSYIRKKLTETDDRVLVEASPVDGFWGHGLDGTGRNELGKIWMELREELRQGE